MRLVITYLGIIVLTLLFISTYVLASISQYLYNQNKVELLSSANVVANITSSYVTGDAEMLPYAIKQLGLSDGIRVIITDAEARVLYDSVPQSTVLGKTLVKDEIMSALKGKDVVNIYDEDVGSVIHAAVSVIYDSATIGAVYLTETAATTDEFISNIQWILIVISAIICLLIGVLSSVMADVIIGPIESLTRLINKMESEALPGKVPVSGKDEIAQLGEAFNKLTDKLNTMEERRRIFVSNASHELKTPLSSIKLLSESVLSMQTLDEEYVREFMTDINGEIDRLSKIIDRLLMLTKLDAETETLDLKLTDITELSERVVKSLTPVAEQKEITLAAMTGTEVLAMVDREKFWQVIYNITDNGIKYTPAGGFVNLYVFDEGDFCRIEIEDNGIGIPEGDVNQIFDRFYRVDKARSRESGGTGLGLSIVNDVVMLHEGKILVDSSENEGTKFIIIIPKKIAAASLS